MSTEVEIMSKRRIDNGKEILYCWGAHHYGQLGMELAEEDGVALPKLHNTVFQNHMIQDIACGKHSTVVVSQDGTVLVTRRTAENGESTNIVEIQKFRRIDALETHTVKKAACGDGHNIVINKLGQLLSWGDNTCGQLGKGFTDATFIYVPKLVKNLENMRVVQVSCGLFHTIVLTDDGYLFTWGQNQYGQLGLGVNTPNADQPQKIQSLQGLTVHQVAAGGNSTFVLTVSGALYSWGSNSCGQLGIGDQINKWFPTLVKTVKTQKIIYVSCGEEHTMALTKDGRVFTFGSGKHGQLGHNTFSDESLPRQVFELMGNTVTQIACGRKHSLAFVPSSGKIYSFGQNAYGQLGDGTLMKHSSPVAVKGPFIADQSLKRKSGSNNISMGSSSDQTNNPCLVRRIYTGGDHCFVICTDIKAQKVVDDFRDTSLFPAVTIFNAETVRYLSSFPPSNKVPEEVKSEVGKIFSSASCINGSFLLGNDEHFGCSHKNHGIDFELAQELFSKLNKLPNGNIIQLVINTIYQYLLPNLPPSPPDTEALRLYLTLPLLPAFDLPVNFDLIIAFGRALVALNNTPGAKIIERWWEALLPEAFERLITIYKRVVVHMMFLPNALSPSEAAMRNKGVVVCMEVLKKINKVNNENTKQRMIVNYEKFYIPEIKDKVDIRKDYVYWTFGKSESAVDEAARSQLMGFFFPSNIDPINPCLVLSISRDNMVRDTIYQIGKKGSKDFKKPLKVKFIDEEAMDAGGVRKVMFQGEDAVDEGGVRKEFFLLLLEEILDPKYGMFKYNEDSHLLWFNESTFETSEMFMLIGVLCGLAIYNSVIIDLHFPIALYKKLLKRPILLEDLKDLQPSVGKSLESLLQYDGDDFEDTFCMCFEITTDVYGEAVTVPLADGGREKTVTKTNRKEFIDLYIDYVFNKSVQQPFTAFYEGFHRVCGGKVLELFHPNELQEMVIGNQNYEWGELEKNTEYKGVFYARHEVIIWFWEVFKDLSEENKRKYIMFLTGSDRIPIHGMKAIKHIIQPVGGGDDFLPVAHTCFNLLDLPKYSTKERLKAKLLLAIQHCKGFGIV